MNTVPSLDTLIDPIVPSPTPPPETTPSDLQAYLASTVPPMLKNSIKSMLAAGADPATIADQLDIPLATIQSIIALKSPADAAEISEDQYRTLVDSVFSLGTSADSESVRLSAALALIERKKPSKGTATTIDVRVTFNDAADKFNESILASLNNAVKSNP